MKQTFFAFFLLSSLFFTACDSPNLYGKKVKKEYFQGGGIRTEFIMDDDTEQNGILKTYGYEGRVTSVVQFHHGVRDGIETGYDKKKRVIWKSKYVNGLQHGVSKAFYPNGDTMISYTYKKGVREGWAYTYRKNGDIDRKVLFHNGKIIN